MRSTLSLADIVDRAHAHRTAVELARAATHFDVHHGTVFVQGAVLVGLGPTGSQVLEHHLPVLRHHQPADVTSDQLLACVAEHLTQLAVHVDDAAVLGDADALERSVIECPESAFAFP
jgi:hypothetical protein